MSFPAHANAPPTNPVLRVLEELTLSTSPAIHHAFHDGWVLRASGNDIRRANSASLLQASRQSVADNIAHIEDWYRRLGQPAMFRLTDAPATAEFEEALQARGYRLDTETQVMTADLTRILADARIELADGAKIVQRSLTDGLHDWHRLKGSSASAEEHDVARQSLWRGAELWASLKTINGLASVGMVRIEAGYAGIFNMRTALRARDKGHASELLSYLLLWAQAQGAHSAFLQVESDNAPALAIYRKFGFAAQYRYWHRIAPKTT